MLNKYFIIIRIWSKNMIKSGYKKLKQDDPIKIIFSWKLSICSNFQYKFIKIC